MNIRDNFKSVFDNDYCGADEFIAKVIKPIFGDKDVEVLEPSIHNPTNADEDTLRKANIEDILWVATIDRIGTDPIQVFDITLGDSTNLSRARVGIQRIIRSALFPYSHAFLLFHHRVLGYAEWRFSYVYKQDKNANTTDAKRYTYLFSRELHARTAIDRFEALANSRKDNDALLDAFNVEALSDDFFEKYRTQYAKFVKYITGKEYIKEGGKYVEKSTGEPNEKLYSAFGRDDKAVRDYVKKMMGRITFLHFLQRKGWMNSDKNFMLHLFQQSKQKADYMDKVLEPLFFGILNTKLEDRSSLFKKAGWNLELLGEWKGLPYLNGGLFEQEPFDCKKAVFPEEYFASLFQFFSEYNFTVDENDPDDAEVGVDPEMLGKIFENLLEDNKDKGAFYTPKEIVRYMCQESLIAYLVEKTKIGENTIRGFVTQPYDVAESLSAKDSDELFDALVAVKICDPAIGSGAFPMGLLNELVRCEEALVLGKEKNNDRAHLKREIIKNNIYGVDIEKGAVDIARLRFWLSLVVDEEEPSPLPNLDYKIMQGNSLLESYKGIDLSHLIEESAERDIFSEAVEPIQEQLEQKKDEYYSCGDHAKKAQLKEDIKNLIIQQLETKGIDLDLSDIDVAGNTHFFLWHTWFADVFKRPQGCNGFDIVIGNPPYISAPAQVDNEILNSQRERIVMSKQYKSLYQKWDLYIPFIELGLQRLTRGGVFSMIVPYPLTNQTYALKLREMLLSDYNLFELVDLNGVKVFENATVSNCIPFVKIESSSTNEVRITRIENEKIVHSHNRRYDEMVQSKKRIWNLIDGHTESGHSGYVLGDLCYISKGMVLNADEQTARGQFKKDDLISLTPDKIHCRKYIEAKDIEPYRVKQYRWLEWNTKRCPDELSRPTFRELYDCEKLMVNRLGKLQVYLDRSERLLHSDSMFSVVPWHMLFGVENKSISASIKRYCRLTRPEMESLSKNITTKYLLAILNSSSASRLLEEQRGGDYHIYPEHLRQIPIPIPDRDTQDELCSIIDKILDAIESNNIKEKDYCQTLIDNIVESLYQSN